MTEGAVYGGVKPFYSLNELPMGFPSFGQAFSSYASLVGVLLSGL